LHAPLSEFLDDFYLDKDKVSQRDRLVDAPPRTGEPYIDAYLGAVGEHLCRRWHLGEPPDWTDDPARFMRLMTFMGLPRERAFMLAESPMAFRRRLIFTEAEPLRRARMPKDARFRSYETLRSGLVLGEYDEDE
jgi:hypothetical protein